MFLKLVKISIELIQSEEILRSANGGSWLEGKFPNDCFMLSELTDTSSRPFLDLHKSKK